MWKYFCDILEILIVEDEYIIFFSIGFGDGQSQKQENDYSNIHQ